MALGPNERLIIAGQLSASVVAQNASQRATFTGNTENGVKNFDALRTAIGVCVSCNCALPALLLIYAGIDVAGALYAPVQEYKANRAKFKEWVSKFMLPKLSLAVTADELWGARCGVVHVYGPSSNHASSNSPLPREISYVTFTPEKAKFAQTMQELQTANNGQPVAPSAVVLSVQEIAVAFDAGWKEMLTEVQQDPARLITFEAHCGEQFEHMQLPAL